jgi:uncharacterized protein (DUF1786 family)
VTTRGRGVSFSVEERRNESTTPRVQGEWSVAPDRERERRLASGPSRERLVAERAREMSRERSRSVDKNLNGRMWGGGWRNVVQEELAKVERAVEAERGRERVREMLSSGERLGRETHH